MDRRTRLAAARREHALFLRTVRALPDEAWGQQSAAPGWSVQDVVAHQSASFSGMFDSFALRALRSDDIESENDRAVASRRSWSPEEILREYETWEPRALRAVALASLPVAAGLPMRVGELGWLPLRLFPSGLVFDSGVHLRLDIAPVLDLQVPPLDPAAADATIEWMLTIGANLGQDSLRCLQGRVVELRFVGGSDQTWALTHDGRRVRMRLGAAGRTEARITTPVDAFTAWATRRTDWQDLAVELDGDVGLAATVADALRVI